MKAITTTKTPRGYTATDGDLNRVRIDYPHEVSGIEARHFEAARALCKKMKWTGKLSGGMQKPGVYVWTWIEEPLSIVFEA